jgi:hypothetical protein
LNFGSRVIKDTKVKVDVLGFTAATCDTPNVAPQSDPVEVNISALRFAIKDPTEVFDAPQHGNGIINLRSLTVEL